MTQDTERVREYTIPIVVWDGTLPARCVICGGSLGKTLRDIVIHCDRLHPGELRAALRGREHD